MGDETLNQADPLIQRIEAFERRAKRIAAALGTVVALAIGVVALGVQMIDSVRAAQDHLHSKLTTVVQTQVAQENHLEFNDARLNMAGAPAPLPPSKVQ